MFSPNTALAAIVIQSPHAARVLHRHRLDFCCGGGKTLAEACAEAGLDAQSLLLEVMQAPGPASSEPNWEERPLDELADFLVERYHKPLAAEFERLIALARKVESVHKDKPTAPKGLASVLVRLRDEVEPHMEKEEQVLFPMIRAGQGYLAQMPIHVMVQDHRVVAEALHEIRRITGDLVPPAEACTSWINLYKSLDQLEVEFMEHIHLENHVLFPRALA